MSELHFQWDPIKNKSNQKKHGVSFEEAQTVFFDENARIIPDPDHSDEEERFILLGISSSTRLLTVCHCYRTSTDLIRIITARKATKTESKWYSVE
ncbi:MAG: BrnT family toxin [Deltaproteobacteria bacterium]|nr:BrnT family toxin [Deltaproteobacteria bacterium]